MDEDNKAVYYKIQQLYTLKPILKERLVLMSQNESNDSNMTTLRTKRNTLLEQTDRYATLDFPHSNLAVQQTWFDYRQALRDLPTATEDPANPVWPVQPSP
jgi:hypothetical protein